MNILNLRSICCNGTMNVMYINDRRPQEKKCFTEKYGTHQCMRAVRENPLKLYGSAADETIIDQEDAFLLRVLDTIRAGLSQSTPTSAMEALLQVLQGIQSRPVPVGEVSQEDQQEADDMALDFVDGF